MRRKGELSPARVDREWPHQIIRPASEGLTQNYNAIHAFCADLSLCISAARTAQKVGSYVSNLLILNAYKVVPRGGSIAR